MRAIYLWLAFCFISSLQYLARGDDQETSESSIIEIDPKDIIKAKKIKDEDEAIDSVNENSITEKEIDKQNEEMEKKTDGAYVNGKNMKKHESNKKVVKTHQKKSKVKPPGNIVNLSLPLKMMRDPAKPKTISNAVLKEERLKRKPKKMLKSYKKKKPSKTRKVNKKTNKKKIQYKKAKQNKLKNRKYIKHAIQGKKRTRKRRDKDKSKGFVFLPPRRKNKIY